jgi:hypothetical protein
MNNPYLILFNKVANKQFKMPFDTEFARDKFMRKLKYSTKLLLVEVGGYYE